MTAIRISAAPDGICLVQIDIPDRAQNVLTPGFFADLDNAAARLRDDDALVGAILTGTPSSGFMAGADLKEVLEMQDRGVTAVEATAWAVANAAVFRRLEQCGKPVVAAINGHALGGGLELALACHHRIVLDRPGIQIGFPEVTLGLLPGAGGTQRLPRLIGIEKALPLLLEGRRLSPAQALDAGIVDAVAADEDALLAAARDWISAHPGGTQPWDAKTFRIAGGAGPLALHAPRSFQATSSRLRANSLRYPAAHKILSAVYEGTQLSFDVGMRVESKYFGVLMAGRVSANLVRAFLRQLEARKPRSGLAHDMPLTIERIAVLGAGMMGAGIANVAAGAGLDVLLLDQTTEAATRGIEHVRRHRLREVERGASSQDRAEQIVARILPISSTDDARPVDLIVEAVFEDRAVKSAIYERTAQMLSPGGLLASNTSTLSISSLAVNLRDPGRFVGLHFFSPVERMNLVEVIAGKNTSDRSVADAFAFVARLRKTPILVQDSPGFYTSRVFCAYIDEAMAMLIEGVSPALIENAARHAGFPSPPLAILDEVSLDLQKLVISQARNDGLDARFLRAHAALVVDRMNGIGRLGRKSQAGFYEYAEGGKHLWPGLSELFPVAQIQPSAEDVAKRLLYIQAVVSIQCLAEGVINDEATADIGSVLGIGYPAWTGGALSIISTVGENDFLADCRRFAEEIGLRFDIAPEGLACAATAAKVARSGERRAA